MRTVIDNLEFLNHRSQKEAEQCLREEGPSKPARMKRMKSLVQLVN
jgi:hypothetical protein